MPANSSTNKEEIMTTRTEFETAFYAASGTYTVDIGGGDLSVYGYFSVPGGFWSDSATGFKTRVYIGK